MPNRVTGGEFSREGEIKGQTACALAVYYACIKPGGLWYVPEPMVQYLLNDVLGKDAKSPFMCPSLKRWHVMSVPQIKGSVGCLAPGENLESFLSGNMDFTGEKKRINVALDSLAEGAERPDWVRKYSGKKIVDLVYENDQKFHFLDSALQEDTYISPSLNMTISDYFAYVQRYMDEKIPSTDQCRQTESHPIEIQR